MTSVGLIANGGCGDILLAIQCSYFVKQAGHHPVIYAYCRKEVFEPIDILFGQDWEVINIQDEQGDKLVSDIDYIKGFCKEKEFYLVWPDLLFTHPFAFPCRKFKCHPQTVRNIRLLTHKWQPSDTIFLGLTSSTDGYVYKYVLELLTLIGKNFPEKTIYIPYIKKWADRNVSFNFESSINPSENIIIDNDPYFAKSLRYLFQSEYGVFADNGLSHVAYQLGMPRLLLDPRTGQIPWVARWRQDLSESIDINSSVQDIVDLIKLNIEQPYTTLLPRNFVMANKGLDWKQNLFIKYG